MNIKSRDCPVGGPFNIAQYAQLTHLVAHITNHKATKLTVNVGDDHIYANQVPYLAEQFTRDQIDCEPAKFILPESVKELDDFIKMTPAELAACFHNYEPGTYHDRINYPVAV